MNTLVNRTFDLMADWHPVVQFIVLLYGTLMLVGGLLMLSNHVVVLVRGYPPAGSGAAPGADADGEPAEFEGESESGSGPAAAANPRA